MNTLVRIPEEASVLIEELRENCYPDLTLPKMLIRIAMEKAKDERRKRLQPEFKEDTNA